MADSRKRLIIIIASCAALILAAGGIIGWNLLNPAEPFAAVIPAPVWLPPEPEVLPEPEPELIPEPEPPPLLYPVGAFGPDQLRLDYVSGEMILRIPRLDFEGPVHSGEVDITPGSATYKSIANSTLDNGVGLFGASQLPSESNSNVSVAGHRDIRGMEFYYIDTIELGDPVYLEYQGKEYSYVVEDIFETTPDDWEPIRVKEYGCITIQSCTPIGIASHRIFVVGRFQGVKDIVGE